MKKIGKYEFTNKTTAQSKINTFAESKHIFIELGNIVITPGDYDEEGNEITAPVLSEMYHVDVLWKGLEPIDPEAETLQYTHPDGWADYAADVNDNGVHSFMGLDYQQYKF